MTFRLHFRLHTLHTPCFGHDPEAKVVTTLIILKKKFNINSRPKNPKILLCNKKKLEIIFDEISTSQS